jgi:Anti-sigma-28 factor, FlgM
MTDAVSAEKPDDMDEEPQMRITDLRQRIARGEYTVEPSAVADAIIRRGRQRAFERAAFQRLCSNPISGEELVASMNTAPGAPATTRPTNVKPSPVRGIRSSLASAGMHAQSS